jgi:2'-5' RNA ligase
VHQVVAEDAHVTLQFLGEAADLSDDQVTEIKQTLEMLASVVYPFDADISGTAELGPTRPRC